MKKVLLFIAISFIAFGGSIDYLSQESADYIRSLTRNGTTDSADAVHYNPAGTAFMDDGLHLSISSTTILKDYSVIAAAPWESEEVEYNTTKPSVIVPSLYGVWKNGKYGIFGGVDVPAGGGSLDYENGVYAMKLLETGFQNTVKAMGGDPFAGAYFANMTDGRFEGSSVFIGGTVGASMMVTDNISMSVGARYISATKTYEGKGDFILINGATQTPDGGTYTRELNAEKTANGIGGILGVNIKASDKINIGMRYETKTELEFETEYKSDDSVWVDNIPVLSSYQDGYKENRDLPGLFAGGIEYIMSEKLKLNFGATYYFIEDADGEDDVILNEGTASEMIIVKEYDDDYENGWEASTGFEYMTSDDLILSAGYQYTKVGGNEDTYNDFEYKLDSHLFGAGGKYMLSDDSAITLGLAYVVYIDGEGAGTYSGADYEKRATVFSIGFGTKM